MRALSISLVVAAVAATAGCTPPPDYLFVDPKVSPVRVELRRSFGVVQKQYGPVPITDCGFFVQPESGEAAGAYKQEIWRVLNTAPDGATLALGYGVVPPGFIQATPPAGAPPPLEPGRHYTVECSGDAIGTAQFEIPKKVTRPVPPLRKRTPEAR